MRYTDIFEEVKGFSPEEGSFGTVHKMRHKEWGYIRAIKELRRIELSERDKAKFEQECKTLLRLSSGNHPNIVTIYNVHPEEEQPFFEMAWIEGENFDDISVGKFMEIDEVFRFISDIGNALAFCHNGGIEEGATIVHNDLHPGNIIRSKVDGRYVLIDFGLAMEDTAQVTSTLARVGAVEYISPERCDIQQFGIESKYFKGKPKPAWDIYSFGCLMYQALTGMPPYQSAGRIEKYKLQNVVGLTPTQIYCAHKKEKVPNGSLHEIKPILKLRKELYEREHPGKNYSQKECPEWLVGLVMNCLEKETPPRYENAQEFMDAFNKSYQGEAKVPRRMLEGKEKELKLAEESLNAAKDVINNLNDDINILNVNLNQTQDELKNSQELLNSFVSKKRIYYWMATTVAVILAISTNCWAISIEPKDSSLIVNTYLLSGISVLTLLILVVLEMQNIQKMK